MTTIDPAQQSSTGLTVTGGYTTSIGEHWIYAGVSVNMSEAIVSLRVQELSLHIRTNPVSHAPQPVGPPIAYVPSIWRRSVYVLPFMQPQVPVAPLKVTVIVGGLPQQGVILLLVLLWLPVLVWLVDPVEVEVSEVLLLWLPTLVDVEVSEVEPVLVLCPDDPDVDVTEVERLVLATLSEVEVVLWLPLLVLVDRLVLVDWLRLVLLIEVLLIEVLLDDELE